MRRFATLDSSRIILVKAGDGQKDDLGFVRLRIAGSSAFSLNLWFLIVAGWKTRATLGASILPYLIISENENRNLRA